MSDAPARLDDLGLPVHLYGVATWICHVGGTCTTLDLQHQWGATGRTVRRWVRDLEALRIVETSPKGATVRVAMCPVKYFRRCAKKESKTARCADCGVLLPRLDVGGLGDYCGRHRQDHRTDAPWLGPARKVWRAAPRLSPYAVQARLLRQHGMSAPVDDYLLEGRTKRMPGLISKGIAWGYLDAEQWTEIKRRREAGDEN